MYGLLIEQPHLGDILDGRCLWDRRPFSTQKRGRIGLVDPSADLLLGFADLTGVRGISYSEYLEQFGGHKMTGDMWAAHRQYYEFRFSKVVKLEKPVKVDRGELEMVWVKIPEYSDSSQKVQRSLFDF